MPANSSIASSESELDQAVQTLQSHKTEWARLPLVDKRALLIATRANMAKMMVEWVQLTAAAKGIQPDSQAIAEVWTLGPWGLGAAINGLLRSLNALIAGNVPQPPRTRTRANGQLVTEIFPADYYDRVLFNDIRVEVWMEPGVTAANLKDHTAVFYKQPDPTGQVTLVLGAGNVDSIPLLDILHELYVNGRVVIMKMNPVNDFLAPLFNRLFSPFVQAGYLRLAKGGVSVGSYLIDHPGVESVHITGSVYSYEAIVFGPGEEGQARKVRNEPLLSKPITSELGGVGPLIVLPGPWAEADLHYQAERIVTMRLHNAGTNCIAPQVLILPENWELGPALLDHIRALFMALPARLAYYPGCSIRYQKALARHPEAEVFDPQNYRLLIPDLDPTAENESCFQEELFGQILAQIYLPGDTPSVFLQNAVRFANDRLYGTLGANIIVHPKTARRMGRLLEAAVDALHYGAVGINIWSAGAFLLPQAAWGGAPGAADTDIQSGRGFVHNSFMFDRPQKTVCYGRFYPFPRTLRHGQFHIAPKPAWFLTNKTAATTLRRVARLQSNPHPKYLPGIIWSALRG